MSGAFKRLSYNRLDSETSLQPPSATLKSPFVSEETHYYGFTSPEEIQLVPVNNSRSPKYDAEDFNREDSPSPIPSRRARSWYRLPSGWRVGITLSAVAAFVSLIANLTLAVWSTTHRGDNSLGVLIEVFRGDCVKASRLNLRGCILAINTISTILLSASNFTMQCVVAPTRADIDRTHAKMKWLDIGVPSLRNIRHISTSEEDDVDTFVSVFPTIAPNVQLGFLRLDCNKRLQCYFCDSQFHHWRRLQHGEWPEYRLLPAPELQGEPDKGTEQCHAARMGAAGERRLYPSVCKRPHHGQKACSCCL